MPHRHSMPFGAEVQTDGRVRFRLWAPAAAQVQLCLEHKREPLPMQAVGEGWYELVSGDAGSGSRYCFRIDNRVNVPDPASRFQSGDVHGSSEVIDPGAWQWRDTEWRGRPWEEAVIYELHVGTFTRQGTFAGVKERLDYLVELGVTAIELMPIADFPGARDWGYDGALPFAPDSRYGRPEGLKALIQAAHLRGLMVFLDVVYNHFGPEGNYLHLYAPQFFTERHHTPWGAAINFDGDDSRTVRDFFIHNALYWLEEYHFDGLRLDAVHAIADDSDPDILVELATAVRKGPGRARQVHLVLENDHNAARYLKRDKAGDSRLYRAQWNDDVHHALHVLLTGESDGYYGDYADQPARHLARCLTEGFAYQGEPSSYRGGAPRGEPSRDLPPTAFVAFLQNHDQIGNRAFGERITELAKPEAIFAAVAVLLLAPSPPLLFMGEECGATNPFLFFCDFAADLAPKVTAGRRKEFERFERFRDPLAREQIPDPNDPSTFARAVLDWTDIGQPPRATWLEHYRILLAVRQREIVPRLRDMRAAGAQYELLGESALSVRWLLGDGTRLCLFANLGEAVAKMNRKPAGRLLHETPATAAEALRRGTVPAWSAVWYLQEEAGQQPAQGATQAGQST